MDLRKESNKFFVAIRSAVAPGNFRVIYFLFASCSLNSTISVFIFLYILSSSLIYASLFLRSFSFMRRLFSSKIIRALKSSVKNLIFSAFFFSRMSLCSWIPFVLALSFRTSFSRSWSISFYLWSIILKHSANFSSRSLILLSRARRVFLKV